MKVGDLVKWTHPQYPSLGIIIELIDLSCREANICWLDDEEDTDGIYPLNHKYLELVSEAR